MVVCNELNISYEETIISAFSSSQNTREEKRNMFYLISVAWMLSFSFFVKFFFLLAFWVIRGMLLRADMKLFAYLLWNEKIIQLILLWILFLMSCWWWMLVVRINELDDLKSEKDFSSLMKFELLELNFYWNLIFLSCSLSNIWMLKEMTPKTLF